MARESITLDNFTDWHGQVDGVEIRSYMDFPDYVPTTDISVNLSRIAMFSRLGRLEGVRIGLYDRQPDVDFGISGTNQDGSAIASAVSISAEDRSSNSVSRPQDDSLEYPRGRGFVRINVGHSDLDNKLLRDAQPWAELLDKGMREGLTISGQKQLTEPRLERRVGFSIDKVIDGIGACALATVFGEVKVIPLYLAYSCLDDSIGFSRKLGAKLIRREPIKDYEHSLLYNLPLDRVVALKTLARTRKIVKAK